ncbi:MAG: FeoB-associated Cys-rich membrane protein [Ruminococcaceae bacterium]|nr:FeoB-associated Cys-rich membrane protein [Oscillospiraceae bacterium]
MNAVDYLVIAVVAVIVGLGIWFIYRSKKKGVKCIGCPDGATCSGKCSSCSSQCSCDRHQ